MPLFGFFIVITIIAGWVMNLVQVIDMTIADSPLTTMFIAKIAGIPLGPLGVVLGWVTALN